MRVLLDHCVPRPLGRHLLGHEVVHTSRLKWGGLQNGRLLAAAESAGFPVMITVDRSMQFQQNIAGRSLSVIYLSVPTNEIARLVEMVDTIQRHLPLLQPGTFLTLVHPSME